MLDRLSLLDASFLERERLATPLHTGAVSVFGSELRFEAVLEVLRARLHLIPHARARVQPSRRLGGRPVWVDDAEFDLTFQLRHAALPAPGSRAQLADYLARLMARPLDRARPLWEVYVIEGLVGGRVAVFRKVHLAMAGGDRGDPFAVLLDEVADSPPAAGPAPQDWRPAPSPGSAELAAGAARDRLEQVAAVGREASRLFVHPSEAGRSAATAAGDLARVASRLVARAPTSPLNRTLGQHRRLAAAALELEDLRSVRRAFGGTVNDVVVTICADAVGRLLRSRGHDTTDLDLRVMVPVRVHGNGEAGSPSTVGDGVVGVVAPLPVMEIDPVARLYRVMGEMAGLKESRQAVAADGLVRLAGFAPPNLHSAAARLVTAEQRYTVALSNAPGPQEPRYLAGVEMEQTYAFLPLAGDSALSIAVTSYRGTVYVGLVGERDAMPDLDALAASLPGALSDLVGAASHLGAV